MRLEVAALAENKTSCSIPQRWAAFSKGSLIGTRNLANCMGIVIYNRIGACGLVAHVESQPNADAYVQAVDDALVTMMTTLNANGGETGSLAVVLLGNAGGSNQDFCSRVEASLLARVGARFRLNKLDLLDLRNSVARGKIGRATTALGGFYGGCILDPANEMLWVDGVGYIADRDGTPGDVEKLAIQ